MEKEEIGRGVPLNPLYDSGASIPAVYGSIPAPRAAPVDFRQFTCFFVRLYTVIMQYCVQWLISLFMTYNCEWVLFGVWMPCLILLIVNAEICHPYKRIGAQIILNLQTTRMNSYIQTNELWMFGKMNKTKKKREENVN